MQQLIDNYKNKLEAKPFLIAFGILLLFFSIYFRLGFYLSETRAFSENDLLFGIDTHRAIHDMTVFSSANHYRTSVHPLYLLLVNPFGAILGKIINSQILSVLLINSFLGGMSVGMAFLFFHWYGKSVFHAILLASFFGLTASQTFLFSIPDTASLAICSLLFTYLVFSFSLKRKKINNSIWVVAGIFSLGVTTTNFVQTFLGYLLITFALQSNKAFRKKVVSVGLYGISVIVITIILALLQKKLYPSSRLFFLPSSFTFELQFASILIFQEPLTVIDQLLKNFFVFNIIAPSPNIITLGDSIRNFPAVTFSISPGFSFIWWVSFALWIFLFTGGLYKSHDNHTKRIIHIFFLLSLGFNWVLHSFYGVGERGLIEYFMYTGNFTFLVVSVLGNLPLEKKKVFVALLGTLILFIAANNFLVLRDIYLIYR